MGAHNGVSLTEADTSELLPSGRQSVFFVTTAKFSKQAEEYAARQRIILVDGNKLARLMIEHDFGVSVKKIFAIKKIDTDTFNEYQENDDA